MLALNPFTSYGSSHQTDNGAFAEYARFNAAVAFKLPEDMTYEEAASFPVCFARLSLIIP